MLSLPSPRLVNWRFLALLLLSHSTNVVDAVLILCPPVVIRVGSSHAWCRQAFGLVGSQVRSVAAESRPPFTQFVSPQLSQLVEEPPSGPQWLHETKLDGFRMAARIDNGRVQLLTRTGRGLRSQLLHLR